MTQLDYDDDDFHAQEQIMGAGVLLWGAVLFTVMLVVIALLRGWV